MEKVGKRCAAKSTELPKELLSTVTFTTHLLPPTKAKSGSTHREHPPDNCNKVVVTATAATTTTTTGEASITISAVNNNNTYVSSNYDENNKYWTTPCTSTKSTAVITNKATSFINSKNNKLILQQQHKQKSKTTAVLNKDFGDENTEICKSISTRSATEETLSSLSTTLPTAIVATAASEITKLSSPAYRVSHHRKNKCNSIENLLITIASALRQVIKLYTTATAKTPLETKRSLHSKVKSLSISTIKPTTAARCKVAAATSTRTKFRLLPSLGATSFFTLLTFVCLETVLLSTVSNCAKTFYMHWNTSNSIFRIDNTDHIIDVNKGNLAFEFDQVHIICPVYEPGTYENETEKYIIYNVSKVEYETCRITNADPRVIAICDKPQKLMFFTITFRPFTPQPGGLEFLPGNDYYFISTSSKDDLYRRIGGRCSTNNMKVVFKVCCAPEEKNKTTVAMGGGSSGGNGVDNSSGGGTGGEPINVDVNSPINVNQQHMNNINTIGINGVNTGLIPGSGINMNGGSVGGNNGIQLKPINGASGTSINTNIDQFNRIPIQTNGINVIGTNIGGGGVGLGNHGGSGIMLTPGGYGGINMIPNSVGGGSVGQYPGHPGQTGIRINNVASQQHHPSHKNNNNNNGKDPVGVDGGGVMDYGFGDSQFLPPIINTNHSNIVQSTMNWPRWGNNDKLNTNYINNQINLTSNNDHESNIYSPSHRPTNNKKNKNDHYDKHPNEVVKNEELTYNSAASSIHANCRWNKQLSASIQSLLLTVKSIITKTTFTVTADTYDISGGSISDIECRSSYSNNSSSSSSNICSSSRSIKNTIFIGNLKFFHEKFKHLILQINPVILLTSLVTLIIIMYYLFIYTLSFSMLYLLSLSLRTLFTAKTLPLSPISSKSLLSSSSTTNDSVFESIKSSYMPVNNRKTLKKVSNINKNFR